MAHASENVKCLVLDEFVDDARQPRLNDQTKTDCLKALVRQIGSEMGIADFKHPPMRSNVPAAKLVQEVLMAVAPEIEALVRKELQDQIARRQGVPATMPSS